MLADGSLVHMIEGSYKAPEISEQFVATHGQYQNLLLSGVHTWRLFACPRAGAGIRIMMSDYKGREHKTRRKTCLTYPSDAGIEPLPGFDHEKALAAADLCCMSVDS